MSPVQGAPAAGSQPRIKTLTQARLAGKAAADVRPAPLGSHPRPRTTERPLRPLAGSQTAQ
eukprot:11710618-Heterocapsa_arctica.AAC.1